eukprot:TRINITY_DN6193_c0_g1_i1.p1 TRINITY_DN6193_c0_g1~~TRINITY_DN6193_c0_g1_i1.p1  ORF type:complete len:266 (-),score=111.54 TRINITY_DN6193_c0_g1_i1:634-1431(-)
MADQKTGGYSTQQPPVAASSTAITDAKSTEDTEHIDLKDEAAKALEAAMKGDSTIKLRAAITVAQSTGLSEEQLAKANTKLIILEAADKKREDAEEALISAVEACVEGSSNVEALAEALERAIEAGADEEILDEAKATLQSKQTLAKAAAASAAAREVAADKEQEEAEDALGQAAVGNDIDVLTDALSRARAAGVSKESLASAVEALEVLQELAQATLDAEEALKNAIAAEHPTLLLAAIELGEEAEASEELLESARSKLAALGQ